MDAKVWAASIRLAWVAIVEVGDMVRGRPMLRGPWFRADPGVRPYTRINAAKLIGSWGRLCGSRRDGRARSITVAARIRCRGSVSGRLDLTNFIFAKLCVRLFSAGMGE